MTFAFVPFGLGGTELLIIGVVALLLFGKRLPEVARSFGQAIPAFRSGLNELDNQAKEITQEVNKEVKSGT